MLNAKVEERFLQDTIFNDAGLSEELDRRGWGAGQEDNVFSN